MKYYFLFFLTLAGQVLIAQTNTDSKTLDFDMSQYSMIHIYNSNGDIDVRGVKSDQAKVEVERTLKATSQKRLKRAMTEIFIDTMVVDDELFVYVNSPYRKLMGGQNQRYLHYQTPYDQWDSKDGIHQVGIESTFELKVSIPYETSLVVSTHKGHILVDEIKGDLAALNHFNDVKLKNVRDVNYAHSHHGDIQVDFIEQPENDISFDTHHGDIKVSFPQAPSLEIEFDSYHGSFYTDFEWQEQSPQFKKVKSKSKRKATYKLEDKTLVSMGNGTQKITFDSHHGDFYILKN